MFEASLLLPLLLGLGAIFFAFDVTGDDNDNDQQSL